MARWRVIGDRVDMLTLVRGNEHVCSRKEWNVGEEMNELEESEEEATGKSFVGLLDERPSLQMHCITKTWTEVGWEGAIHTQHTTQGASNTRQLIWSGVNLNNCCRFDSSAIQCARGGETFDER